MKIKKLWSFLLIIAISFYLVPLMIKDTGIGMLVLLVVLPIISYICSMIYGMGNTFHPLFSLCVVLLYIPTVFLYYNSSAMIYALIYGLLSLTGLYIGTLVSRKYGKTDDGKREDYRKKSEGIL